MIAMEGLAPALKKRPHPTLKNGRSIVVVAGTCTDTLLTIVARPQTSGYDPNNDFDFIRLTEAIGSLRDDTHVEGLRGGENVERYIFPEFQ